MDVCVGPLDGLPIEKCVSTVAGRAIVVRLADRVVAFENRCLHQDSPLEGGWIAGDVLVCPMHFWRYRLPDGVSVGSGRRLVSYPVTVRDGQVYVDVPDPEPPQSMRATLLEHARAWESRRGAGP